MHACAENKEWQDPAHDNQWEEQGQRSRDFSFLSQETFLGNSNYSA